MIPVLYKGDIIGKAVDKPDAEMVFRDFITEKHRGYLPIEQQVPRSSTMTEQVHCFDRESEELRRERKDKAEGRLVNAAYFYAREINGGFQILLNPERKRVKIPKWA